MKVGIAGLGFMGRTHLSAYAKLGGVQLSVVRVNGSSLGDAAVHALDICLPTDLHAEAAMAALEAGKHVFCEKPMSLNKADCERMISAAERNARVLMIGHVLRFWPEYEYLREFVESQSYGLILSATFVRRSGLPDWSRWLLEEQRSGGAVLDLLIHDIDQVLMLFGAPERVAAKSLGPSDTLAATFLYPKGPEVRLQGGWFRGTMPLSMSFQIRAQRAELQFTPQGLMLSDDTGLRRAVEVQSTDAYETEIAYFVECCENRVEPARCMPRDSAKAVAVAQLLKASRAHGGEQLQCSV